MLPNLNFGDVLKLIELIAKKMRNASGGCAGFTLDDSSAVWWPLNFIKILFLKNQEKIKYF
jgi:hypothetical protein